MATGSEIIAPRMMIPVRKPARRVVARVASCCFPRTHETRCAGCDLSDDGIDDTFVLVRSRRSLPPHVLATVGLRPNLRKARGCIGAAIRRRLRSMLSSQHAPTAFAATARYRHAGMLLDNLGIDLGDEVRESIDSRFGPPPVIVVCPIAGELHRWRAVLQLHSSLHSLE
jgi:hypothetical protein